LFAETPIQKYPIPHVSLPFTRYRTFLLQVEGGEEEEEEGVEEQAEEATHQEEPEEQLVEPLPNTDSPPPPQRTIFNLTCIGEESMVQPSPTPSPNNSER
jgi:hypothetical protein